MNPAHPSTFPGGGIVRALGRSLAVIALTWTALALGWTLLPVESATRRATREAFQPFRSLTGLEQHWDMFVSAPLHRSYEVTVEVSPPGAGFGSGGVRLGTGPVLPGLEEVPASFRYHSFFTRLDGKRHAAWLAPYAERLGRELARRHPDWRGGSFRIRKTGGRLQRLETIRDLGDIDYEETSFHGPFPIPAAETDRDSFGPP